MILDPDAGLVRKAQQGDKAAFGKLVNQYHEMVYAISYGVVGNREGALDVTQEVFLKAFRTLEAFEGKSKFKTWLHRVTVNAAIDHSRKKRPMQSLDVHEDDEENDRMPIVVRETGLNPREKAEQEETTVLLKEALENLSPEHKAVLVLREYQGLSYDEIAESLGIELGTVMSRLFYARKKLAEILGQGVFKEIL